MTKNWVQYQVARSGETPRINADSPNMCLVVATGVTYSALALGLGTVHPNCRVSHYGFKNDDSSTAWTNTAWLSSSSASPRSLDEGINMVLRFPTLDPGASITFSWAYILNQADLLPALNSIASVTIVQPTDTASGRSCTFSANIGAATTLVQFYVQTGSVTSLVGSATVATVPDTTSGGGLYQVTFDTTSFVSADGYSVRACLLVIPGPVVTFGVLSLRNLLKQKCVRALKYTGATTR